MNLKVIVTIFLLAAVPVYAQAQNPGTAKVSKGDAEKVVTIIGGRQSQNPNLLRYGETRFAGRGSLREERQQNGRGIVPEN
jgi:hypothetical protein